MAEIATNSEFLSLKLPPDLKVILQRDAAALGISISAAARLRLRSGHVPAFPIHTHAISLNVPRQ
jgi:hypothetical protein